MSFYHNNKTYNLTITNTVYSELMDVADTYTFQIEKDCEIVIELIGGGGGAFHYDTGGSYHWGFNGGGGAIFKGIAKLTKGTLTIVVGEAGLNAHNVPNTDGKAGGDSYATFTPEGGSSVEIARAGGGDYSYTDFLDQNRDPNSIIYGGQVTYDADYFPEVLINLSGVNCNGRTYNTNI